MGPELFPQKLGVYKSDQNMNLIFQCLELFSLGNSLSFISSALYILASTWLSKLFDPFEQLE